MTFIYKRCENNYIHFAFFNTIRPDCYYIAVDDDKIIHFEICRSIQIKNEIKNQIVKILINV